MAYYNSRSVRFQDDVELTKFTTKGDNMNNLEYKIDGTHKSEPSSKKAHRDVPEKIGKSLRSKVLPGVFPEEFERVKKTILDPRGSVLHRWNKIFLVACVISLFIDPLFAFLPGIDADVSCINIGISLEVALTVIRSVVDVFYFIHIVVRFRTAYVAPSSRVFGRGEIVIDPSKIAFRYLTGSFWIDLLAALPLPQVFIWAIIPNLDGPTMTNAKNALYFIIIFQYLPRLFLIFPLSSQIVKSTGVVKETAWAGAAYNLMLFILAGHVLGACYYLFSIERQESCWKMLCMPPCEYSFFDCHEKNKTSRVDWFNSSSSNISTLCLPSTNSSNPNTFIQFGIYSHGITLGVASTPFFVKYFYGLWWALMSLSSLGQNNNASTYVEEIIFAMTIPILGLVLFALVIGNMQTYLQSNSIRLEEWRNKASDAEQWMRHRQLPQELRQYVRRYDQYRWTETQGVDEATLLNGLPFDLRRSIKRHLCFDLVRRVPLFDQMDERMLDAICERLEPALRTQGACLVREGDLVHDMLFIVRGQLDSYTTDGGRTGFFNSCRIGPGDFCGEELLTWALDPRPTVILPSSTRTVKAISEVEAFVLSAEDLKFVASQFRRLHSKQLRHTFRFYSHQWRTWAACFIQAAWRRFKRRKEAGEVMAGDSPMATSPERAFDQTDSMSLLQPGMSLATKFAARLAASTRRGRGGSSVVTSYRKPAEPDFTVDD